MSVSVFRCYTDIQLDAGLPTPTPDRLALEQDPHERENLRTLERAIRQRFPAGDIRLAEFPAIVTSNSWTRLGVVHDPNADAPYVNVWSPVKLDCPRPMYEVVAVVSGAGVTFVAGDGHLNAAIGIHVRRLMGDVDTIPAAINGRGHFVRTEDVL